MNSDPVSELREGSKNLLEIREELNKMQERLIVIAKDPLSR